MDLSRELDPAVGSGGIRVVAAAALELVQNNTYDDTDADADNDDYDNYNDYDNVNNHINNNNNNINNNINTNNNNNENNVVINIMITSDTKPWRCKEIRLEGWYFQIWWWK